jgi:restriction system protein
MAIWLIRAGENGRYEEKFLQDSRIYVTLPGLSVNLAILPDRDGLSKAMARSYTSEKPQRLNSLVNQIWPFAHEMNKGDLVLLLLARQPSVTIGEVTGDYRFEHAAADPFYHWRSVIWIAREVPRAHFGTDLLLSLSSRLTFSRIRRNNAEQRLADMRANEWKPEPAAGYTEESDELIEGIDFEAAARDQITRVITLHFNGGSLTELVAAVLKARGYSTSKSCSGLDEGLILAGTGHLGFGSQRLCVKVLMTREPVDKPALDSLLESAAKNGAQEALLVSWGGFTEPAREQPASDFFRLRLWSRQELLDELTSCYGMFDDAVKAGLQLKPVWISAVQEP